MDHKDYRRINAWLKDLKDKGYIERIYSTDFLEKTKPAIYYLGLNGIRWLSLQLAATKDGEEVPAYPLQELRKRYRESSRSEGFKNRSMLIADCCILLESETTPDTRYVPIVHAQYIHPHHSFHFLAESETIMPHLCVVKEHDTKNSRIITNYLLEVFDATLPRYRLKYRLKQYLTYLSDDEWESGENDPPPIILLVCANLTDLIYAKRRVKTLIDNEWDDEDQDKPHIRFTTAQQLKQHGITAKIWEEVR